MIQRADDNTQLESLGTILRDNLTQPYVLLAIGNGGVRTYNDLNQYGVLPRSTRVLLTDQADHDYYVRVNRGRKGYARMITTVRDSRDMKPIWTIDDPLDEDVGHRINPEGYDTWLVLESNIERTGNGLLGGVVFGAYNAEQLGTKEIVTAAQVDKVGIAHFPGERIVPKGARTYPKLTEFLKGERRKLYRYLEENDALGVLSDRDLPRGYRIDPQGASDWFGKLGKLNIL